MVIAVTPNVPGLANSIQPTTVISAGAQNLYTFDWLFGFVTSVVVYTALSYIVPHTESRLEGTVYGDVVLEASGSDVESMDEGGVKRNYGAEETDLGMRKEKEIS